MQRSKSDSDECLDGSLRAAPREERQAINVTHNIVSVSLMSGSNKIMLLTSIDFTLLLCAAIHEVDLNIYV